MRLNNNEFEDHLGDYFADIRENSHLSNKEERELAQRIENGDEEARQQLIESNLKFVVNVAKKYRDCGIPFSDIISAGNIGLINAADKFDYRKGVRFISYAVFWIRNSIHDMITSYRKGVEEDSFDDYYDYSSDNEEFEYQCDLVNSEFEERIIEKYTSREAVNDIMSELDERESKILTLYFGLHDKDEMTLDEIGKDMNLTMERVRQLKDRPITKVKFAALKSDEFETYKTFYH